MLINGTPIPSAEVATQPSLTPSSSPTMPAPAVEVTPTPSQPPPVENAVYVATTGNDDNSGTFEQPWRTIQYAIDRATPGITVYIRAGGYDESINMHCSGEETKPITLMPFEGEAVTINGGAAPAVIDTTGTQYWTIAGFTLQSAAEHTILLDAWGCGGTCGGTHHWRIANNRILGSVQLYGSAGMFEDNEVDGSQHFGNENGVWELYDISHHNVFRRNHIHHFYYRGMWSMHRTHDTLIEDNHIHDIGTGPERGMCIDTDGFGTVEWRHIIRGNHLHHCSDGGIELENTFDSIVENNIIHDTGRRGIDVINYGRTLAVRTGEGDYCQAGGENNQYGDTDGDNDCEGDITGNIIRQNLIYGGASSGGIVLLHAGGVKIWGNTVYGTQGPSVSLDSGIEFCPQIELRGNLLTHSSITITLIDLASLVADDHNLLYPLKSRIAYEQRDVWRNFSLADYQAATGLGQASIQADPLFANPGGGDFSLQASSLAINAGIDIGLSSDLNGIARPQGAGFDMGAFELIR